MDACFHIHTQGSSLLRLECYQQSFLNAIDFIPITFWHAAKTRIFRISRRQGFPLIPLQFHRQSILNSNNFSPITFLHIIHAFFTICSGNNKRTRKSEKRSFFFSPFSSSVFSSSCLPQAMSTLYRTAFRVNMKNTSAQCKQKRPRIETSFLHTGFFWKRVNIS